MKLREGFTLNQKIEERGSQKSLKCVGSELNKWNRARKTIEVEKWGHKGG